MALNDGGCTDARDAKIDAACRRSRSEKLRIPQGALDWRQDTTGADGDPRGGEIGSEVHKGHDQRLYFVAETEVARIGDVETMIADGDTSIVPSGVFHNFRNTGSGMLKLLTTYSPPEHAPGTEHATKVEAGQ